MIFEKDILYISILDVIYLRQENVNTSNSKRNFDALSFRIRSDACIKTEKSSHQTENGSVCFFPAGLNYRRIASVDELIVVHFRTAESSEQSIISFTPENTEVFARLFKRILDLWQRKETGYKYECTAILYEIFAECHKQYARRAERNTLDLDAPEQIAERTDRKGDENNGESLFTDTAQIIEHFGRLPYFASKRGLPWV